MRKENQGPAPKAQPSYVDPKNAKEPIEWQADYFSSCLLMPEKEIREAFEKVCAPEPLIVRSSVTDSGEGSSKQPYLEQWPFIAAAMCEAGAIKSVRGALL